MSLTNIRKNMLSVVLSQLIVCFFIFSFSSCSTSRLHTITIETRVPAKITFPEHIQKLLVVNNSAQQPDNVGHRLITGKKDYQIPISCDSAAYDFCVALGESIADEGFEIFDDVRLCEDTIRYDSLYYSSTPFNSNDVSVLCQDYDVDAVLSLDKMYFGSSLTETVQNIYTYNAAIFGTVRLQYFGQDSIYTFHFTDSLETEFYLYYDTIPRESLTMALRYLSEMTAKKIYGYFVPSWEPCMRWFYKSLSSDWKEGSVYASNEKWDKALERWRTLLPSANKWKPKARLLHNLSLCYEMLGDLEKAYDYAGQSYELFKENKGEGYEYTKIHKIYFDVLKERIDNENLLSKQLRKNL